MFKEKCDSVEDLTLQTNKAPPISQRCFVLLFIFYFEMYSFSNSQIFKLSNLYFPIHPRFNSIHCRSAKGYRCSSFIHRCFYSIHRRSGKGYRRSASIHHRFNSIHRLSSKGYRRSTSIHRGFQTRHRCSG